jgi:hypothetical protein
MRSRGNSRGVIDKEHAAFSDCTTISWRYTTDAMIVNVVKVDRVVLMSVDGG